jgi:hypothetical protein
MSNPQKNSLISWVATFFICACLALSSSTQWFVEQIKVLKFVLCIFVFKNESNILIFCILTWDFVHVPIGFELWKLFQYSQNVAIYLLILCPKKGNTHNKGLPKPYYPSIKIHNVIICEPYWGENNLMLLYLYSVSKPMEKNYSFTWGYIKTIYMHNTSLTNVNKIWDWHKFKFRL